jgi:predicted ferric reductase
VVYKIGLDKTLLRTGKICGLLALTLICAQSIAGLRPKLLEQAFGAPLLLRWHRRGGALIVLFAVLHVLLILEPAHEGEIMHRPADCAALAADTPGRGET